MVSTLQTGAIDNLENSGEISGGAGEAGVDVNIITTKLFNKKGGTISGGFAGLIVRNRIGELENNGVISGRDSDGSGIFMSTPDLLPGSNTRIDTLTNRGAITGGDNGIQTTSIGVLTNSGRIAGGNSTARDANNSGLYVFNRITTLTNTSTGDISGGQRGVSAASIGRLDNNGRIRGANEVGINTTGNITTLINRSAGDISGGQRGVSAASIASLNNSGRIRGAANAGVRLTGTDATVTVTNSGTIQGGTYGLNYGNNAITRLQNTTKDQRHPGRAQRGPERGQPCHPEQRRYYRLHLRRGHHPDRQDNPGGHRQQQRHDSGPDPRPQLRRPCHHPPDSTVPARP